MSPNSLVILIHVKIVGHLAIHGVMRGDLEKIRGPRSVFTHHNNVKSLRGSGYSQHACITCFQLIEYGRHSQC